MNDKVNEDKSDEIKLPKLSPEFIKRQIEFIWGMEELETKIEKEEKAERLRKEKEKEMIAKCGIYENFEDDENDLQ